MEAPRWEPVADLSVGGVPLPPADHEQRRAVPTADGGDRIGFQPPRCRFTVLPQIPPMAQDGTLQGTVELRLLIDDRPLTSGRRLPATDRPVPEQHRAGAPSY